jgi:uncharacterized protein YndB with AHSA1/START domain
MKTQYDLPAETEIAFTRAFPVAREQMWAMWTQAQHLACWWGPEGWTLPVCEVDFRVGGQWFYCMQGPDMRSCGLATYHEIEAPASIVYTDAFADADGQVLDSMPAGRTRLTFSESDGITTVRGVTRYDSQSQRDAILDMGVKDGLDQTLNRLEAYLATLM